MAGLKLPVAAHPPTEAFRRVFATTSSTSLYFQQPGPADAEMAADPRRAMLRLLVAYGTTPAGPNPRRCAWTRPEGFTDQLAEPQRLLDWLTAAELDHYAQECPGAPGSPGPELVSA